MNKRKQGGVPQTSAASTQILGSNLHLLDLDRHEEWGSISLDVLSTKDTGPNQKARIQCVEWILYHLFHLWDAGETANKLQPFFPPFESLQSINLRAAIFRCLNQLKLDGTLGKDVMLRKTMLDDCKGEKVIDLLTSFSTLVLRRVLEGKKAGKSSITRHILFAEDCHPSEFATSLLPLAIAHQADLRKILDRKKTLRARYKEFGRMLDLKDRELDTKFERVVETQIHLDENIASEATVARIGRQLELHWQGDRRYIDVVAQGEERTTNDALLDISFQKIWPTVTDGSYHEDLTVSRHGLLEDLERRVEVQNGRLREWQELKAQMLSSAKPSSPTKQKNLPASPGKASYPHRGMEKDLVFSPRKSPRKSMFPPESAAGPPTLNGSKLNCKQHQTVNSPSSKQEPDNDDSGFSEVASRDVTVQLNSLSRSQSTASNQNETPADVSSTARPTNDAGTPKETSPSQIDGQDGHPISNSKNLHNLIKINDESNEEDAEAEQIISHIVNASPTPMKPTLSLIERTRQSMAQASPGPRLDTQSHHPSRSLSDDTHTQSLDHSLPLDPKATLLERTRQSISLVPPKPRQPRISMHNRRNSKIYPTNQFETPRKFGAAKELTPPDELFSPGAGYDSVFKSRPKVGFSPTSTPEPTGLEDDGIDLKGPQAALKGDLEESPLARLVAKV